MKRISCLFWLSLSCLGYSETRYVVKDNPNAAAPYTNWITAAATIQAAVDASASNDTIWVTNGVYETGGRTAKGALTNRVVIDKPVVVRSVRGPKVTLIKGAGPEGKAAIRCVYLGTNATLIGFTLTNGHTGLSSDLNGLGGGILCETSSVLSNCTLSGNRGAYGGGAYKGALYNCALIGNLAFYGGGGICGGTLKNSILNGNSTIMSGGGALGSALYNCTLTGNSAKKGGGASGGTLYNCIAYYNTAESYPNISGSDLHYCCITPHSGGLDSITEEPLLADFSHVSKGSPCVGRGISFYASGADIDGEAWSNPPSIGCDEVHSGAATGSLSIAIEVAYTNVSVGFSLAFTARIEGHAAAHRWNFGDGIVISNRPYAFHSWSNAGIYPVTLTTWNESNPQGISTTARVAVVQFVHYAKAGNSTPAFPFITWETAASNIQDAVDAAAPGSVVWVTNGVYDTGGRTRNGMLTNRVTIAKPLIVRSVNGPEVTFIQGSADPESTNGYAAVRCVYLGTNAALIGFTLTNGHTTRHYAPWYANQANINGGGIFCESSTILSNCILTGNSACNYGGGVYGGALYHCALIGNSASNGGGAWCSTLNYCALAGNRANNGGGGAGGDMMVYSGILSNCTVSGNSAIFGGGTDNCTLYNCKLMGNWALAVGGANGGALYGCALSGNSAMICGGAGYGELTHCTLTGNSASYEGGGVMYGTLNNCIVYYNTAPSNSNFDSYTALNYCCTIPNPGGTGNMTNEPLLADALHLNAASPCIGHGSVAYASGTDIDGESWFSPPSMGCDERHAGAVTGSLSVAIQTVDRLVGVGVIADFTGRIEGHAASNSWSFGDGMMISNRPYASHAWSSAGIYPVVLTAWNESNLGVSATVQVTAVSQPIHYVKADHLMPASPYLRWETAATNIQDAVDVAVSNDIILVADGVYDTGGRTANGALTNRVAIDKSVVVRSVNGPEVTIIKGAGPKGDAAIRCVYLGTNATLIGFTLTDGHTRTWTSSRDDDSGGGVFCEPSAVLSNCVLTGNSADSQGGGTFFGALYHCTLTRNSAYLDGGGACSGTLYNCVLTSNSASHGGGTFYSTLYNCTLTGNSAYYGGGAFDGTLYNCALIDNSVDGGAASGGGMWGSTLYNCILYHNRAPVAPNFISGTLNYCCATPDPGGTGNITNDPLFVDYEDGNLHLQSNSPCINTGINQDWMAGSTDLDGNPRIRRGQVDMGAYESDHWGQFSDLDADGFSDWIEVYRTGTDPTNAASYLGMGIPIESDGANTGLVVRWPSAAEKTYRLARTTNLMEDFISFSNRLNATPPMNTYTDETAIGWGPWYYRVGVE